MTEKTAKCNLLLPRRELLPLSSTSRTLVDPVAFFVAMLASPLATGIVALPTLVAPAATLLGGPVYLAIGIPFMLIYMARHRPTARQWALLALKTHVALFAPLTFLLFFIGENENVASIYFFFGLIFAPLWGFFSGKIYHALERDFYKRTL